MARKLAANLNSQSSEEQQRCQIQGHPSQQWVQLLTTDDWVVCGPEGAERVRAKQRQAMAKAKLKASQPFAPSFLDICLQPLCKCGWNCQFCWYELKATWKMMFSSCCSYLLRRKQAAGLWLWSVVTAREGHCNFTCWAFFCWCALIL